LLAEKDAEAFDRVFGPKARAGLSMYVSLKPKRMLSMGSVAARFGNAGQADYSASNELLAALARADGRDIVISIQNEREWADFCREVLREPELPQDPRAASNAARVANRPWLDGKVAAVFASLSSADLIDRLTASQTAYGNVNGVHDLIAHPQLRTRRMPIGEKSVEVPALPWITQWDAAQFPPAPSIDQHGAALREEFASSDADPTVARDV
jgi:crotonobetainyl-CoA:carnitine CoA-transferase CaiB-like acyl-CoA transferase